MIGKRTAELERQIRELEQRREYIDTVGNIGKRGVRREIAARQRELGQTGQQEQSLRRGFTAKLIIGAVVVLAVWAAVAYIGQWSVADPATLAVAMGGVPEDAEIAGAFGKAFVYGLPFMILWGIIQFVRGGRSVE